MSEYIELLKESQVWLKIHSESEVTKITEYLADSSIDYSSIDNFINYIQQIFNLEEKIISHKLLVSILMISKFPNDIIGSDRNETEESIYQKALEIYNLINTCNLENINKKLITFKIIFNDWKSQDKLNQINLLCEMYHKYTDSLAEYTFDEATDEMILSQNSEITDTMDDEKKEEFVEKARQHEKEAKNDFITKINNMRNKILHSLKRLTPNYKSYVKNYKLKDVKYDESVYKMFYTKMKHIYWSNIRKDIFEKKDKNVYHHILNDYVTIFESLEISNIDIDCLKSYLDYDISEDNLTEACVTICKQFIETNKQIDSENYDEIYDTLYAKLVNNENYVTHIYKFCFDRLETIKKIKTTLKLNQDLE